MKLQTYSDGTRILIKEDAEGNRISATRVEEGATTKTISAMAASIKSVEESVTATIVFPTLISEEEVDTDDGTKSDGTESPDGKDAGTEIDGTPVSVEPDDTGAGTPDSEPSEPIK